MTETDLQRTMQRRIRTHMIVSITAVVIGFLCVGAVGATANALFPGDPGLLRVIPLFGILIIPVVGFTSTYKNLRCPACEGSVAWQVSGKFSLFGGAFSNDCRHCHAEIFSPLSSKRFIRMLVIMAVAGILLALGGAVMGGLSARHEHAAVETPVTPTER